MSNVSDQVSKLWRTATAATFEANLKAAQELIAKHPDDAEAKGYLEGFAMLRGALGLTKKK